MKIMHIIPGSGGTFYCDNCLRDKLLIEALRRHGHDVILVPMYLPTSIYDPDPTEGRPVFFGAVNLYIKQMFPLYGKFPSFMQRWLDSAPVLAMAAKKAGSTRAKGLAEMTYSMLLGEDGNQAEDLEKLISWIRVEGKPDVIYLANALLLGLARRIKRELGVPIVCALQNEHTWVDVMEGDYPERVWKLIAERSADVDAFVPVSRTYGSVLREKIGVGEDRMKVVHIGIDPEGYETSPLTFDPPVIGYLSRMCRSMGFEILVEAFIHLRKKMGYTAPRLHLMGGNTGDDLPLIRKMRRRIAREGLASDVIFFDKFLQADRIRFLKTLSLLSVPTIEEDAFGIFQLESLAAGVPLVLPRVGAYPEMVEWTGGGVLYEPNTPEALADALAALLDDPEKARALGKNGRQLFFQELTSRHTAAKLLDVYKGVVAGTG